MAHIPLRPAVERQARTLVRWPSPRARSSPRRRRLGGWGGCLLWALAFVFVVAAGCSVGLVLRPDPYEPAQVASGQGWKVQVHNDHGDKCVNLVIGNNVRTAQCDFLVDGEFRATSYEVGGGQVRDLRPGARGRRARCGSAGRRLASPVVDAEEKKGIRYFVYDADGPDKGPTGCSTRRRRITP